MAEQSLLGVFGPTPEQLQKLRAQQEQERSMFAARIGPSYSAGFGLGNLLGGVVANIFGIEDPELKKARDVREIFNEIAKEGPITDNAVLYDQMAYRLAERGYGDLAAQSTAQANQIRLMQEDRASKLLNDESLRAQRDALVSQTEFNTARKNIETAYNIGQGLKSLQNSNVAPEKFDVAFQSAIGKLQQLGIDTTILESADNPEDQAAGVDYLIGLGTSQKTRTTQDIAADKLSLAGRVQAYKEKVKEIDQKLAQEKFDEKTKEFYIGEKNKLKRAIISASAVDKRLGAQLQGQEEQTRRNMLDNIDTTDQTKLDIKMLSESYNLPLGEATKAVKLLQAKIKDYGYEKNPDGTFKYSLSKARDLALQDVAGGITQEGGILGFGKKGKVGNVKPNEKKIIKLD